MPIPNYQTLMLPVLSCLADGEVHKIRDIYPLMASEFNLTEEEAHQLLPSGKTTTIKNRVAWARTYLRKACLLTAPSRGLVQITDRGKQILSQRPECIDNTFLMQFEEFREFRNAGNLPQDSSPINEISEITPEERLEQAHKELNAEIASELLDAIKLTTPQFFEQLVVDLMQSMGYGGWSAYSGSATQYGADGGIDGVINDDPLGLETIYLQAKRYKEATIGRPDIQSFAGALDMKRAKKGVFITASQFSREAIEYVGMIDKKIVLIDGSQLADLMIKYNLGVTLKETYYIKALDTDYFSED